MRILIVEDDVRLAEVIGRGLRKHAYATDIAADGEEGLYYAEINDYDLMIFDVMLPKKNGFEMSQILRGKKVEIPILMLTARDAVADRVMGLDSGADDYLVKPFDFSELLARVRALLRRRPNLVEARIGVGNLVLNRNLRTAQRAEREIDLTAKEYALLEFLMENADRVVTREQIAEHVWDINFDAFSNVIDTPVTVIRSETEVALTEPRGESEAFQSLAMIRDESVRLSRLVDDMFTLARADADDCNILLNDRVLIGEIVETCARSAQTLGRSRQVRVELVNNIPSTVVVMGDRIRIAQMILNILDNAAKYVSAGGIVTINAEIVENELNPQAQIQIEDNGPGISDDLKEAVFTRFYRVDKARTRAAGGSGLGLPIARSIAELHGGSIRLTDARIGGSVFTITLPVAAQS